MKRKVFMVILVLIMGLSIVGCAKGSEENNTLNTSEIIEESEEESTKTEMETSVTDDSEDTSEEKSTEESILEGQTYSYQIMMTPRNVAPEDISAYYLKIVSGDEYTYKMSRPDKTQVYFDGTNQYVYTNASPYSENSEEYVWVMNADNPFEAMENDIYGAMTQSNFDKFAEDEEYNFIEFMPYIKSLGYEKVLLCGTSPEYEWVRFDLYYNSSDEYASYTLDISSGSETAGYQIEVPEITEYTEAKDFE